MPDVWFAIPGDIGTLTGGYIYARRLIDELPSAGWAPRLLTLPSTFPSPSRDDLNQTGEILKGVPANSVLLIDGLALGAIPQDILNKLNADLVALVHHPLALESGLSERDQEKLFVSEKTALGHARSIITTGPDTAKTLVDRYGVTSDKIFVARPGTDPAQRTEVQNTAPQLLTVATLTFRKGHDVLISALAQLVDLDWKSVWIGSQTRERDTATKLQNAIKSHGLNDRIEICGEIAAGKLGNFYAQSDLFVLPSRHEGYGMAFAEALAHGLPIVACAEGAVPDTVPAAAGLLVPANNPTALSEALRALLTDRDRLKDMAIAAWRSGQKLPRWTDTAAAVANALNATP